MDNDWEWDDLDSEGYSNYYMEPPDSDYSSYTDLDVDTAILTDEEYDRYLDHESYGFNNPAEYDRERIRSNRTIDKRAKNKSQKLSKKRVYHKGALWKGKKPANWIDRGDGNPTFFDLIGNFIINDEIFYICAVKTPNKELERSPKRPIFQLKSNWHTMKRSTKWNLTLKSNDGKIPKISNASMDGALWKSRFAGKKTSSGKKAADLSGYIMIDNDRYEMAGWLNSLEHLNKNPRVPIINIYLRN